MSKNDGGAALQNAVQAARNADQVIWRAWKGDYYADSIHVTHEGNIGISCGGTVYVMPVREWHALARAARDARDAQ